jgi:hypothetical protein
MLGGIVGNRGCDSLVSWEFAEAYFHAEELAAEAERVRLGIVREIAEETFLGGGYLRLSGLVARRLAEAHKSRVLS